MSLEVKAQFPEHEILQGGCNPTGGTVSLGLRERMGNYGSNYGQAGKLKGEKPRI